MYLVRQAVETEALQTGCTEIARQGHDFGDGRLAPMEARVETGDLRHAGKPFRDRVNRRQVVRLMERRKRYQVTKLVEHLPGDDRRRGKARPAVDDAVTDADDASAPVSRAQPVAKRIQRRAGISHHPFVEGGVG